MPQMTTPISSSTRTVKSRRLLFHNLSISSHVPTQRIRLLTQRSLLWKMMERWMTKDKRSIKQDPLRVDAIAEPKTQRKAKKALRKIACNRRPSKTRSLSFTPFTTCQSKLIKRIKLLKTHLTDRGGILPELS